MLNEYIGDVNVDFAGEGVVDKEAGGGVGSSIDGSADGLDFNGGPRRVWYCILGSSCLVGLPWKRRGGVKMGLGAKFYGAVARAKAVVIVLMMLY